MGSTLTTYMMMLAIQLVLFFDHISKSVLICVSIISPVKHYLDLRILFATLLSVSALSASISWRVRSWTMIIQTEAIWALSLRNGLDFFTFFAWVVRLEDVWSCCRGCTRISPSHSFVFICPFCETGWPGCCRCRSIFTFLAHFFIIWGILDKISSIFDPPRRLMTAFYHRRPTTFLLLFDLEKLTFLAQIYRLLSSVRV